MLRTCRTRHREDGRGTLSQLLRRTLSRTPARGRRARLSGNVLAGCHHHTWAAPRAAHASGTRRAAHLHACSAPGNPGTSAGSASELRQVVSADHAPGARSDAPRRLDARRGPLRRSRRSPFVAVEPMRRSRRRSSRRTEAIRRRRTAGSLIGTPPAPREARVTFEPWDEVDLPMPTPASKGAGALTTRAFRRRTLPKWLSWVRT